MATRRNGTTATGERWSDMEIEAVWRKGTPIERQDETQIRRDACGAMIQHSNYGGTTEEGTGWEIDHITPVALGGGDELDNLQPLQWQNNRAKGDGPLRCVIPAKRAR